MAIRGLFLLATAALAACDFPFNPLAPGANPRGPTDIAAAVVATAAGISDSAAIAVR